MADNLGKMIDLAPREAAIEKSLANWARFHLTLDRAIEAEGDAEAQETYSARQLFEFGKVLACQTACPLTRSHFEHALRAAGAEPEAEARFSDRYAELKLQVIKARTLETACAYKHTRRRAEERVAAAKTPGGFFPLQVMEQAKRWLVRRPAPVLPAASDPGSSLLS
ncbi:MAG: hypothetical protein PW734_01100 [Verrucomicrobium sp.]|nr:hypothetical protein [Verrucomicrobium sp.]